MNKVAVVTDSTAYLPAEVMRDLPITVLPLQLIWGEETFRDGVDIQNVEFYARLKTSQVMPTTSQTTPATFKAAFDSLLNEGWDIFSVHISSKLSGTMDSALQAAAQIKSDRIHVFDSLTAGMALGFQALKAARASANGASLKDCVDQAEGVRARTGVYFVPYTLEYLKRGGRIGGAAALLGTVLDLKPILKVIDGKIDAVEKVRTMSRAIDRMLDLVEDSIKPFKSSIHLAGQYCDTPDAARLVVERAVQRFGSAAVEEKFVVPVSPVIGTHFGPGGMGLSFMAGV